MANRKMRGGDHIAAALRDHNVRTVFSLSGNQIMSVYDALFDTDIRVIHTRHEGAAVYMAEAAAQISGDVAIALLTAAPGFANGLSALYTARQSETPLVVLSGDSPLARDGRGAFQEMDQCAAAAPLAKASFRATSAAGLYHDVVRAIQMAKAGRPGPVHIALPDDILRQQAAAAIRPTPAAPPPAPPGLTADIQTALRDSAAPLVLAGPTFCRPAWKPAIRSLAGRLNVPVVAFESPRGLRAPRLGAFAEVAGRADLVVTLGKPLDFMIGFGEVLNDACRIIQIDAEAAVLARDAKAHAGRDLHQHHALPAAIIERLLADPATAGPATANHNAPNHGANAWQQEVEAALAYRPPSWREPPSAGAIDSLAFATAIGAFTTAHPDAALIIDGGEIGQWSQALADADVSIINGPSGAIGASLPYAIAASVVRPDHPVLAVMGDGTAGFYLAEFETAVRENTAFVAVIGNDAKWNAEHQIQLRDYGAARAFACTLSPARYDLVAQGLGGYGELVTEASEIMPAIERGFAAARPACINVMIDGQAAPAIARR
ncbi:MAG: thiamine pyrophosphate-binding protein [Pseudomonadota bacterium]